MHRLSEIDGPARRAICAECGPVRVYRRKRGDGRRDGWRCATPQKRARVARARALGWPQHTNRRYEHGLTRREAEAFKAGKVCAICSGARNLQVDHDHKTRAIRGVLCNGCNTAIGALGDSAEGVRRAVAYLEAAQ